jgi:Phage integrase family
MRWEQTDLKAGLVHVARLKNGLPSTHPIRGPELRALRELRRDYPETPYLFVTERGGPMTPATARKLIGRAGELAKFPFPIHPHMLRHSAGYKLADEGHDTRSIQQYLGHRNITHTVRYTELSPDRFKNFLAGLSTEAVCPGSTRSCRSRPAAICARNPYQRSCGTETAKMCSVLASCQSGALSRPAQSNSGYCRQTVHALRNCDQGKWPNPAPMRLGPVHEHAPILSLKTNLAAIPSYDFFDPSLLGIPENCP